MPTLARLQYVPQYVSTLRSVIGLYTGFIYDTYADKPSEQNFYEVIKNDPAVSHAINLLSLMAAGESCKVTCTNPDLQKMLSYMLANIEDFTHTRKSLVENSVLYGLGIQRKYYRKITMPDFPGVSFTACYRMQEVDRRRLIIERPTDEKSRTEAYWCLWDPKFDQFVVLEDRAENQFARDGYAVQDFVWFRNQEEELNPFYRGLGDVLYQLCYIKSKVIMYWADLCESWAKPLLTLFTDTMKGGMDTAFDSAHPSNETKVVEALKALEKTRARHVGVFDNSDKFELHEGGSTGNNILKDLLEYCDKRIQLLILGAELATEAPSTGSYALGSIHRQQMDSIVMYNRLRLAEKLVRDLFLDFCIRNSGALRHLDVPRPQIGDIKFKMTVEQEEMQKQMEAQKQGRENQMGNPQSQWVQERNEQMEDALGGGQAGK